MDNAQSRFSDRLRTGSHLIRDVDGDGLMVVVEPLAFYPMVHAGRVYVRKSPLTSSPLSPAGDGTRLAIPSGARAGLFDDVHEDAR